MVHSQSQSLSEGMLRLLMPKALAGRHNKRQRSSFGDGLKKAGPENIRGRPYIKELANDYTLGLSCSAPAQYAVRGLKLNTLRQLSRLYITKTGNPLSSKLDCSIFSGNKKVSEREMIPHMEFEVRSANYYVSFVTSVPKQPTVLA